MTARRRALVLTLASLLLWEAWEGLRPMHHPWGDFSVGNYTDHFSHMNAARLFPRLGAGIWRRSYDQLFSLLSDEERCRLPSDLQAGGSWSGGIYRVPGWPSDKQLVSSWSHKPRLYPPGDMLLVAPIALAYHRTSLSFSAANRLLLLLYILYAHFAVFLLFESLLGASGRSVWERAIVGLVIYGEVMHWSIEGFYDAAVLAPLMLSARYLAQRRGWAAIVGYTAAAALHFRALFYAPWAVAAVVLLVRQRAWRGLGARQIAAAAAAAVLSLAALGPFFLIVPTLRNQISNNPLHVGEPLRLVAVVVILAAAVLALGVARAWLDLAVLGWLALMIALVNETYHWHVLLVLLPWLAAPVAETRRPTLVRWVRIAVTFAAAGLVYGNSLLPDWLYHHV